MARAPIEIMIDNLNMKCVRCGTPMKTGCSCWEKIEFRCPGCGRSKKTYREPSDPIGCKVVELKCPKCWDEGSM